MNIRFYLLAVMALVCFSAQSQELDNQVLMTVDGTPVYASEFVRVYNKNLELVQDESQKDVEQYMDLFVDYKLKIREAEEQGLDTILKFKREFQTYRNQLARNFLTDTKVTENLVKEAYDRTIEEVNANHILIRVDENASAQDSLKAYNKILEIREQAINGKDFEVLARQYSQDPSAKENAGNLGWFTALRMVYDFEDQAYKTAVGEISEPFRTRFGYHILKVNERRKANGEVEVAHIMVAPKPKDAAFSAESRIKELYQKVQQGEDFGVLAKQFSDDRNSARDEGKLNRFGSGKLNSPKFENVAFSLKEAGEVSEPFETQYGWHIVKLLEKFPIGTYAEMRGELEKKVTKDSRANLISDALIDTLKVNYGIGDQREAISFFNSFITDDISKGTWRATDTTGLDKVLFSLRDTDITYKDFAEYAYRKQSRKGTSGDKAVLIDKWMKSFVKETLVDYHRENLESEDAEFNNVVQEYRDGLLLFDLMEKNIWQKAKKDTLGLRQFYENNSDKYQWPKRVDVTIAKVNNKADAKTVRSLLKNGIVESEIKAKINSEADLSTLFTSGTFSIDNQELPKGYKPKVGVAKAVKDGDYYVIVKTKNVIPAGPKTLKEAKGKVVSDYQDFIEKKWLASLSEKYDVTINQNVLNSLKQRLEN